MTDHSIPKRFEYIGAGTWAWSQAAGDAPLRFEFLDTGLCLSVYNKEPKETASLELSKCETASQWRFEKVDEHGEKVDEHGSRIKLDGSSEWAAGDREAYDADWVRLLP